MLDTLSPAEFVWLQLNRDGAVWLVFPHPEHAFTLSHGKRLIHSFVMRTPEGELVAAEGSGKAWTAQRISEFLFATRRGPAAPSGAVEDDHHSSRYTECSPSARARLLIDAFDPAFWRTRCVAAMVCADRAVQLGAPGSPEDCARAAEALDAALQGAIQTGLQRFASAAVDAELAQLSMRDGGLDLRIYNYLLEPSQRRNRVQFVRDFPVLAGVVAAAPRSGHAAAARRWVDQGQPLLTNLARRLQVSPATLRTLRRVPQEVVGGALKAFPWDLVRILDALCPEDRPRCPEHWRELERACAQGARQFGPRPWGSPLAAAWLRAAARGNWRLIRHPREPSHPIGREQISALNQLRGQAHLALVIESELGGSIGNPALLDSLARSLVARTLARMALPQLLHLAQRYRDLVNHTLAQRTTTSQPDDLLQYLPLLPRPYLTRDGTRLIECLTSRPHIRATGRILHNCLANWHAAGHFERCATGQSFLLRLRPASGGPVLSVAHLQMEFDRSSRAPRLVLIEHRGVGNALPYHLCAQAVIEVMQSLTGGVLREHLLRLATVVRRGDAPWHGQDDLERIDQCRQLVRNVFGAKLYQRWMVELYAAVDQHSYPLLADPARRLVALCDWPADAQPLADADLAACESADAEVTDDIPF